MVLGPWGKESRAMLKMELGFLFLMVSFSGVPSVAALDPCPLVWAQNIDSSSNAHSMPEPACFVSVCDAEPPRVMVP